MQSDAHSNVLRELEVETESEDEADLDVERQDSRTQQSTVACPDEQADNCKVCVVQTMNLCKACACPEQGSHHRLRSSCASEVEQQGHGCTVCRTHPD